MKVDVGLIEIGVCVAFIEDCANKSSAAGTSVMMSPPLPCLSLDSSWNNSHTNLDSEKYVYIISS